MRSKGKFRDKIVDLKYPLPDLIFYPNTGNMLYKYGLYWTQSLKRSFYLRFAQISSYLHKVNVLIVKNSNMVTRHSVQTWYLDVIKEAISGSDD